MSQRARDLLQYLDASPTPYHAVAETARRLEAVGFHRLDEADAWELAPGEFAYTTRGDGSIAAFQLGTRPVAESGFRIIGAHTDSPNLRVKPAADTSSAGYRQLAVEPYGGVLLYTWLDRDLSLAGRVALVRDGVVRTVLVDFDRPLLRIPSLAIHLNRNLREDGLKLNPQQHVTPMLGLESTPQLLELLVEELRRSDLQVGPEHVVGFDLMTADCQRAAIGGSRGEFLMSGRLDNLASCHAAVCALSEAEDLGSGEATRVVVLYDHEEVGSRSAQGASGTFLADVLSRLAAVGESAAPQDLARAMSRSLLVSADMAPAVHPNYSDRHDAGHRPSLGGGPVNKSNVGLSYASDADTIGRFRALCRGVGLEPQLFAVRNDMPCGSTIGPITSARIGIPTVDVGNPMLAMHSVRETAAIDDVDPMIDVLAAHLAAAG